VSAQPRFPSVKLFSRGVCASVCLSVCLPSRVYRVVSARLNTRSEEEFLTAGPTLPGDGHIAHLSGSPGDAR